MWPQVLDINYSLFEAPKQSSRHTELIVRRICLIKIIKPQFPLYNFIESNPINYKLLLRCVLLYYIKNYFDYTDHNFQILQLSNEKKRQKTTTDQNWWHLGYYQVWNKDTKPMVLVLLSQWLHKMKPERKPPCTAVVCFVAPLAYWSWVCTCVYVQCWISTAVLSAAVLRESLYNTT